MYKCIKCIKWEKNKHSNQTKFYLFMTRVDLR